VFESKGTAVAEPATLASLLEQLQSFQPTGDAAAGIEVLGLLEQVKSAAAAAAACQAVVFVDARRAEQTIAGVRSKEVGRGVAHEVALAKRCSPQQARNYLGWARTLTSELPTTLRELRAGRTSEWRAMVMARETGWLSQPNRARVDAEIGPLLGQYGDRKAEREARALAQRLDPAGAAARARNAESDRHVSLRPAPDTMCRLSALLPVSQGVAAYASLRAAAESARAAGDDRSRGQVMADTLVQRVTGQAQAGQVPTTINLVMRPGTLTGRGPDTDTPALLDGYGPVPAPVARALATRTGSAPVWLRRLFTDRAGRLISMETRQRCFTASQREYLRLRDQTCATPYCDAPIRHADHLNPAKDGGTTSLTNAQSLCEACNYAKQAPGWTTRREPDGTITITTPTGHRYESRPPDIPGTSPPTPNRHKADIIHLHSTLEAEHRRLAG
jgi:uncharacterized protein DUF222/HNH endonuclease